MLRIVYRVKKPIQPLLVTRIVIFDPGRMVLCRPRSTTAPARLRRTLKADPQERRRCLQVTFTAAPAGTFPTLMSSNAKVEPAVPCKTGLG